MATDVRELKPATQKQTEAVVDAVQRGLPIPAGFAFNPGVPPFVFRLDPKNSDVPKVAVPDEGGEDNETVQPVPDVQAAEEGGTG